VDFLLARQMTAINVASTTAVQLYSVPPGAGGYVELTSRDAWSTYEVVDVVHNIERSYRYRLGPAHSRALIRIEEHGASVRVIGCTVAAGITFSQLTGAQTTDTAVPTWTARWLQHDPGYSAQSRSLVVGGDTADVAAIGAGSSLVLGAAPGYARCAFIQTSQPAYVEILDRAGTVPATLPVSNQTTIECSPEWRFKLYNSGAAAMNAVVTWAQGV
jgi:hypothetical protein